jgi:dienelactone hydrolase
MNPGLRRLLARGLAAAALGAAMASAAPAQQRVSVPSLELQHGTPVLLAGFWFPVDQAPAPPAGRPAVLMLHGCGGAYDRHGALTSRLRDYAALLNLEGWHALVLDSLSVRGLSELCTQRPSSRTVKVLNRRKDALGALEWLAQQPGVDRERLALLGWSNGGSTVLAATNRRADEVKDAPAPPRAAAAFYPGCEQELRRGYEPAAPLLMLVGDSDDWTPPQACRDLARAARGAPVRLVVYPGAVHGFDGEGGVRVRRDVPGGARPGQGVHVGGQKAAREDSRDQLLAFLRAQLR